MAAKLARAILLVHGLDPKGNDDQTIHLQYNPTELVYEKGAQLAEVGIPGLDAPLQQFVRGQAEKLTVELFFDTTDQGMGDKARSVTALTDQIYQLVKIDGARHAPPPCTFLWNEQFPGSSLGKKSDTAKDGGATSGAPNQGGSTASGNQRRNGFQGVVESVRQKFTLFSPEGVPLRATLTVTLREYRPLDEQLARQNPRSPDRTHAHVLKGGETLASVAGDYYERPAEWRAIADANDIDDPRRLNPGTRLLVPPIS
jgi:hypothetical protein